MNIVMKHVSRVMVAWLTFFIDLDGFDIPIFQYSFVGCCR